MNRSILIQVSAIISLLLGLVFVYQPKIILLHGLALPLFLIGAVILAVVSSQSQARTPAKALIEIVSAVAILLGLVFLYLPSESLLRGSALHILLSGTFAFAIVSPRKKWIEIISVCAIVVGLIFLFQQSNAVLRGSSLYILLASILAFAIVSPRKRLVEWLGISMIAFGLIALCQPLHIIFYKTGFQILLTGTVAFIVVGHR